MWKWTRFCASKLYPSSDRWWNVPWKIGFLWLSICYPSSSTIWLTSSEERLAHFKYYSGLVDCLRHQDRPKTALRDDSTSWKNNFWYLGFCVVHFYVSSNNLNGEIAGSIRIIWNSPKQRRSVTPISARSCTQNDLWIHWTSQRTPWRPAART